MSAILDESKPYDVVYGSSKGIKYCQEGRCYNGRKELVGTDGKPILVTKGVPLPKKSSEAIEAIPRENPVVDNTRTKTGQFRSKKGASK